MLRCGDCKVKEEVIFLLSAVETKLVQVPPEQLKPIVASYRTTCRASRANGSLSRERKIAVLLHQVTWQGLPIQRVRLFPRL